VPVGGGVRRGEGGGGVGRCGCEFMQTLPRVRNRVVPRSHV
jgi:hypothetical protein